MHRFLFLVVVALLCPRTAAQLERLGRIEFPSSGASQAQEPFLRGVLLLHSFEYEDAAEAFRQAQASDPAFALAYWGEALTHCHPIWQEEDREAALAALAKLASTREERAARAPTERERGLLASVEVLFGEGDRTTRARAYERALAALQERFPSDAEIAAFHALALLGSATSGRDTALYMRAAAIAEEVLATNPDHPGALHYAIHSYDDPLHAPLGLRMARRYGEVAAAAEHALHMPSHIYVALGMWRESAAANEASSAAADARRARKELSLEARGYHSLSWLCYSYLQLGRGADARRLLDDMRRDAEQSGSKRTRSHLVAMRAAGVFASDDWEHERARLVIDVAELERASAVAELFVQGFGALERSQREEAEAALAAIGRQKSAFESAAPPGAQDCCAPSASGYVPGRSAVNVMEQELAGLLALERGDEEQGLSLLAGAAREEDAMGFDFGPPAVVKPAHELLGEVLLERGRAAEAVREFEAALRRAPRRSRSLLGLARAATAAGQDELARGSYAELASIWIDADEDWPGLEEARKSAVPVR